MSLSDYDFDSYLARLNTLFPKGTIPSAARTLGIAPNTLRSYLQKGDIGIRMLERIAQVSGTTVEWIVTGRGRGDQEISASSIGKDAWLYATPEHQHGIDYLRALGLTDRLMHAYGLDPRFVQIYRVDSDVMGSTMAFGDLAVTNEADCEARDGLFVIDLENRPEVRRLQFSGDFVYVISDNMAYPPHKISRAQALRGIRGRVYLKVRMDRP